MTFKWMCALKWEPIFIFGFIYAKHKGVTKQYVCNGLFLFDKYQWQKENKTEVILKISSRRISFDMFFFFYD